MTGCRAIAEFLKFEKKWIYTLALNCTVGVSEAARKSLRNRLTMRLGIKTEAMEQRTAVGSAERGGKRSEGRTKCAEKELWASIKGLFGSLQRRRRQDRDEIRIGEAAKRREGLRLTSLHCG